jgi:DNA polymerase-3 subunit gamma/tau
MTEHTALYRTYRPNTFDAVVGQEHVTSVLQAAIANQKIAHAYLFYGTRGTGKTTMARIFARALGATNKDIYEMDAASNRRVEDFRELNDSTYTLPFESPYKVYIIDEAHMLTKEAFNAFLKTLEEPPAHVVFILATTEPDKLPDTIVSRCQTFAFNKPTPAVLAQVITRVAKKEGYTLERATFRILVAKFARNKNLK